MKTTKRHGRRYPWKEWFSKGKFKLVRGRDYNGRTDTFIQRIYSKAGPSGYNIGIGITVSDDNNSITVRVTPKHKGRGRPNANGRK